MEIPDSTLVGLIKKVISWISLGNSDSNTVSFGSKMTENKGNACFHCEEKTLDSCNKYHCQSCGRLLCGKCVQGLASSDVAASSCLKKKMEAMFNIKTCKLCFELSPISKISRKSSGKVYPSESPRQSPEPPSPSFRGDIFDGHSSHDLTRTTDESLSYYKAPESVHLSSSRSNEDEREDSTSHFYDMSSEYFHNTSDVDSFCLSARHEFIDFTSLESSPSDSPSRIHITSTRDGHYYIQREHGGNSSSQNDGSFDQEPALLEKPGAGTLNPIFRRKDEKLPEPLNFETNGLIWIPPPPDDEEEISFFIYDDEDDEVGDSGAMFSSNAGLDIMLLAHKKARMNQRGPLRAVVKGHFTALVFQLLKGEEIVSPKENCSEDWLNIITTIAWQAATFIKPDSSRGGSMDPCDYVKVKCVASGSPSDSKLIKGVVCTKNIKHKRMPSQYRNARILLLGGSLEYQRVPNQLASFDTLLQQEKDHLKKIVSQIEALRPNVLLVEKSVSSFAQDQLLEKEISLVLNVKRPLLERIARCSGAAITPSTDHLHKTRLGHCELFHLEKNMEDHEPVNPFNKRPSKTLMFFEGCPRRLGCSVLLKGSSQEELKKVKNVVQYAVFAAYHLSLETSYLADEGATLPQIGPKSSHFTPEKTVLDVPDLIATTTYREEVVVPPNLNNGLQESVPDLEDVGVGYDDDSEPDEFRYRKALLNACNENLALDVMHDDTRQTHTTIESPFQVESQSDEVKANDACEYYSASDNRQSILVSFSSHCILNGTVCERSRLLRVKFYGPSDKPLGRYLREDLFDESSHCRSCSELTEYHAICYTHQQGNLMINVRRLSSVRLPGEKDGKIWMWHRCLKCTHIDGVPPASRRVVMSDAAWGLSFGKFLELSFSSHAKGNRVASCGHSLQRDCLRFYGFGSMIAFFRYSAINILSVCLPPAILEFGGPRTQSWIRKEASELLSKAETLYGEISAVLQEINFRSLSFMHEFSDANDLHRHVLELNDMLAKEQNYYQDLLQWPNKEIQQQAVDILEINRLRHSLLISSQVWERRLYLLDSLLRRSPSPKASNNVEALNGLKDSLTYSKHQSLDLDNGPEHPKPEESLANNWECESELSLQEDYISSTDKVVQHEMNVCSSTYLDRHPSAASILSDQIDSAWSGADLVPLKAPFLVMLNGDVSETDSARKINPSFERLLPPVRVYSIDSAQRNQERKNLSTLRSFHASGDYKYMIRDLVLNGQTSYSEVLPHEAKRLNLASGLSPSFIPFPSLFPEGARLVVPQNGQHDIVGTVYDDEPTSIIAYALSSTEYADWISDKQNMAERGSNASLVGGVNSIASDLSTWQSIGSLDLDYLHYSNYSSEDASSTVGSLFSDPKSSHLRMSFEDESSSSKMKFSVTCYFGRQFDALRSRCCPSELDFIHSLSRCQRWTAQGGKSNVYFAKSFDERFIIKQVTKTELESFEEFSSEYFKYLTDAVISGSPTCLAKILGLYQVAMKPSKSGKETKMDLMVMENLFFNRSISKVYDLKGSTRSRYNANTTGSDKVLLDMNLLETLRTNPIFLGSKAKRELERAVWNDTSFLASIDVMDYSLLVGVDEEGKELVLGIIDYMRQYTWDKHLETWVKASGMLGGPKNASPTIVSPKQYKKRFRKAMTAYFLTVPHHQWSS